MSDMPERIWASFAERRYKGRRRLLITGGPEDGYCAMINENHVNELVAAAYDAGFYSVVGGEGEYAPPTDATAALAARDARIREAALRDAANVAAEYGDQSYAAKMISSAIEDLIEKDTTNVD